MKFLKTGVFMLIGCAAMLSQTPGPGNAPEGIKHIPASGGGALSAMNIERGVQYPALIHLRGQVEIKAPGFVLRADDATYDEKTGEITATGNVRVAPYPARARR